MSRTTLRTHGASHIPREFHFVQHALEFGCLNLTNHHQAFVAYDFREVFLNYGERTPAAIGIAEIRMRNDRNTLVTHDIEYPARRSL